MTYLEKHVEKRRYPATLAESTGGDFHTIIVLGVNHHQFPLPPEIKYNPSLGIIASYAWGDDYHEIVRPALYALDAFIGETTGRKSRGKCLVDTGPVLERDWAQATGLGFFGKNCCIIHPRLGSWLLLATVMVPEILEPDPPPEVLSTKSLPPEAVIKGLPPEQEHGRWSFPLHSSAFDANENQRDCVVQARQPPAPRVGTCGRCTRCLDGCPTDAFVGPYHLQPTLCISYWTIESRSPIPKTLRRSFGNRIFGCDICQELCPWNLHLAERSPMMGGLLAQAERVAPPLLEGFQSDTPYWLQQDAFGQRFRRSPIKRARRAGMLRNVCVALGNWADPVAVNALSIALKDDEALARGHAAWALGEIRRRHHVESVDPLLKSALNSEGVDWVQEEIRQALRADEDEADAT